MFSCDVPTTISLGSPVEVPSGATIDGNSQVTLDGGGATQLLLLSGGGVATLQNIQFANGRGPEGGCVYVDGPRPFGVVVRNAAFTGCQSTAQKGGALSVVWGGTVECENVVFWRNSAPITNEQCVAAAPLMPFA